MKNSVITIVLFLFVNSISGQITFKSGEDVTSADLRARVGEDVTSADIRLRIGQDVISADFTVGITNKKSQADFIVTDGYNYDKRVRAGEDVTSADIRIRAGEDVTSADVRVKIKTSGTVDYIVFIDKEDITLNDIVIALLPAINKEMDYKFDDIPIHVEKSSQSNENYTDVIAALNGAKIFAQDDENTYLGKVASEYDSESIFNEYGTYGSEYNSKCIWNEYSTFGNEYNSLSPFNDYSSNPPMIIKNGKIIGYLTTNESISGGISPYVLKGIKDKF